jgi:hypothetical protein
MADCEGDAEPATIRSRPQSPARPGANSAARFRPNVAVAHARADSAPTLNYISRKYNSRLRQRYITPELAVSTTVTHTATMAKAGAHGLKNS